MKHQFSYFTLFLLCFLLWFSNLFVEYTKDEIAGAIGILTLYAIGVVIRKLREV